MNKKAAFTKNGILCKALAVVTGTALLAGWILTGKTGIGSEDKAVYEAAVKLQPEVDQLGFQDFRLENYPVAMYDGKKDSVFYQGKIEERAPVLETFAGTAYPVGDHFEVVVPTLEQMDGMMSLAGGIEGMTAGSGYGKEEQIATIWHEGFHAWQMSSFAILGEKMTAEELTAELENMDEGTTGKDAGEQDGESEEQILVKAVDQKADVKKAVAQEMKTLKAIADKGSALKGEESKTGIDEMKSAVLEYRKSEEQRRKGMPAEAVKAEQRCELTEGTAYYVEANILKMQEGGGEAEYQKRYLDTLGQFEGGRGKYYRTGMAKCLILDQISPDWKRQIDFSKSLDELLDEAVMS